MDRLATTRAALGKLRLLSTELRTWSHGSPRCCDGTTCKFADPSYECSDAVAACCESLPCSCRHIPSQLPCPTARHSAPPLPAEELLERDGSSPEGVQADARHMCSQGLLPACFLPGLPETRATSRKFVPAVPPAVRRTRAGTSFGHAASMLSSSRRG